MIIFLNSCDPGWTYYLIRPSMDEGKPEYANRYICINDSLNIELFAHDFALGTYVELKLETPLDSIEIYPNFSYIESPYFVDKSHIPDRINIKCFSDGTLKYEKLYLIREKDKSYGWEIQKESWEKDNVVIKEEKEGKTISKAEFLKPYLLQKNDSLLVLFRYRSFAIYSDRSFFGYPASEKSDFIFYCDIYGNKTPLVFHFATKKSGNHEKR
jgi:hypothetical protein